MSGLDTRVFPGDFQDGLTLGSCSALTLTGGVLRSPPGWGAVALAHPALGCLSRPSMFCVFHPLFCFTATQGAFRKDINVQAQSSRF